MPGFTSITGDESIMFADNVSFDGTQRGGKLTLNGQLLIGSTIAPHVKVGHIVSGGSLTIGYSAGNIIADINPPVSIANGGTNSTSMTNTDGVVFFDGTKLSTTAVGSSTQVLTSNGAGLAPTFQTVSAVGTIAGDTGTATGSTITLNGLSNAGSSVSFSATGSTVSLNTTDSLSNTIIGKLAGNSSITGSLNTVLGNNAGHALTSSSLNVLIGRDTGKLITSGSGENTFIGAESGTKITTGNNNILIGYNSGVNLAVGTESNNIIIGANGLNNQSNNIFLGTSGIHTNAYIASVSTNVLTSGNLVVVDSNDQVGTGPAPSITAGQVVMTDGVKWTSSTTAYPTTTTINRILFSSAANTIGQITTANNGLLVTSSGGVPSILGGPGANNQVLVSNAAAAPSFTGSPTLSGKVTATGFTATADPGGTVSTNTMSNANSTTISTGVGSVKMSSVNAATNTGWLKCYIGTAVAWIPTWTTNSP